jgi:hypothetical protein
MALQRGSKILSEKTGLCPTSRSGRNLGGVIKLFSLDLVFGIPELVVKYMAEQDSVKNDSVCLMLVEGRALLVRIRQYLQEKLGGVAFRTQNYCEQVVKRSSRTAVKLMFCISRFTNLRAIWTHKSDLIERCSANV